MMLRTAGGRICAQGAACGLTVRRPVEGDAMSTVVTEIAERVKALAPAQLDEFLSWLAEYESATADEWDMEIARDSLPGGRLDAAMKRARADIAAGRARPLDEILHNA